MLRRRNRSYNGKPVALLISAEDEDEIERLVSAYSPKLQAIIQTAEQEIRTGKGITREDFWCAVEEN